MQLQTETKKCIFIESQLCDFYSNAIISDKFQESQVAQTLQYYERPNYKQCTQEGWHLANVSVFDRSII